MNTLKTFSMRITLGIVLLCGLSLAQAATYSFTIEGTVDAGEEAFGPGSNAFGLSFGDTITASGLFTADLGTVGSETGTVYFSTGTGNTLSIDLNGTVLTETDDDGFLSGLGPFLTFNAGALTDFDFQTSGVFNSSFLSFDNFENSTMFGSWTSVTLTEVPVPAAVWLLGSGLLGLVGIARRKARA
jgi:hypothetical protein